MNSVKRGSAESWRNELQTVVQQGYGLSAEISCCRGVYLLQTDLGELVLKRMRTGTDRSYLIGKLLEQSHSDGLLPQLISTKYGGSYFFQNGNRYLLTTKLAGREGDYLNFEDFLSALHGMRLFHATAAPLIATDPAWQVIKFSVVALWQWRLRELLVCRRLAQHDSSEFGKQYLSRWAYFYLQASLALSLSQLQRIQSEPRLCYHDWACHNLLLDQGRVGLFDFEYLILDVGAHDQANLLGKYLRLYSYDEVRFAQAMQALRDNYPCRAAERQLLRAYLTFPYDYWMLGRQYYLERQPWALKHYWQQWRRKIEVEPQRARVLSWLRDF